MLRRNLLAWTILLGLGLFAVPDVGAQQDPALPADQCLVSMDLPPGTKITVDGRDYGEQSEFDFDGLVPGQVYPSLMALTFRSGERLERTVLIQGGRRIRLAELDPREPHAEMVVQQGHAHSVYCVACSPDGRTLVSGGYDKTIKVWDAASGRLLRTIQANQGYVMTVVYSPDGRTLASASADKTIKLWDAVDGRMLRTLEGHEDSVSELAYSPDGRTLASASSDETIKLWDAADGRLQRTIVGHQGSVNSVAYSPDGRTLASASSDKTIKLWNAADGRVLRTIQTHESWGVECAVYSPDGRTLASTSHDNTIKLWDAGDGKLLRTISAHEFDVNCLSYSPDGRTLASAGVEDKTIKLWDAANGELLQTIQAHEDSVQSVVYSLDGRTLASASNDGKIKLWDMADCRLSRTLAGHEGSVASVAYSPDGRMLALGSHDWTIKLWDAVDGRMLRTLEGHEGIVCSVAYSHDGRRLASCSYDRTIKLWDAASGRLLRTLPGHDDWVHCVAYSPDDLTLASAGNDKTIKLWDAADGRLLRTLEGRAYVVYSVAYSPDGRTLASGNSNATIELWDIASGRLLRTLQGHSDWVHSVAYTPDGRTLASSSEDRTIKLWEAANGRMLRTLEGRDDVVYSVAYSPDGHTLASGNELWDAANGRSLRTRNDQEDNVREVAYSPDGSTLAVGGQTGLRLFDPFTGKELCQLHSFENGDWLVTTPEGLFDGNEGGQQRVFYRVGTGLQIAPVAYFRQDYYRAGLLARLMSGERPLPTSKSQGKMPPTIAIESPTDRAVVDSSETTLRFTLKNAGGGLGPVQARRNGATIELDEVASTAESTTYSSRIELEPGENRIFVTARAADRGSLESSRSISIFCRKDLVRADLYVLSLGVSEYELKELKLDFAAADAQQISRVFTERAERLYGKLYSYPLYDADATKEKLKAACAEIAKKAKPQDTLLVFLAGHGKRIADQFYFLPVNLEGTRENDVIRDGIDTDILFDDYLRGLEAGKRILVIDACHAGAAIQRRTRDSYTMQDMVARLAHDKGIYTLAGASEDETAEERPELQHGALTYTLLAALGEVDFGPLQNQKILTDTPVVTVTDWFGFATKHLPILAPDQNAQQQIEGQNFPLLPAPP